MDRHRWPWVGRLLRLLALPDPFEPGPLDLPAWAAWADEPAVTPAPAAAPLPRPLAAQLASTARLNVPAGRRPYTALAKMPTNRRAVPLVEATVKRAPVPRSVHLQARHIAMHVAARDAEPAHSRRTADTAVPAIAPFAHAA